MNKTKDNFFFMKKPNRNSGFVKTCDEHILGAISTSTRLAEKCFLRPLGTLFAIKALAYSCAQKGPNGDDFCLKKKERYLVSQVLLMQFRKTQVHCLSSISLVLLQKAGISWKRNIAMKNMLPKGSFRTFQATYLLKLWLYRL